MEDTVNLHSMAHIDTIDLVRSCFHSNPSSGYAFLARDAEVVLVTKSDHDANALHLWYIRGGKDAGSANDDLVVLLGTVRSGTGALAPGYLTADCITTLDSL